MSLDSTKRGATVAYAQIFKLVVDHIRRYTMCMLMMLKIQYFRNRYKYRYIICLLFCFLATSQCQSEKEFIKRQPPDTNFANVQIGDVVYSTTDFKPENDRQRLVYKYWKFGKSDIKSITLVYEEHLDFIKLKPDFKEEKIYEFDKNYTVRIQGMILEIYKLSVNSMSYYIRSGG
jgi:hypothetical protein